ncbi:unnamed protein product [Phytomonas sp. EM1]|nr:unnamed protein product [Phytomonas sp. EM1]|eukprot:CCW63872.1 unnamed protein product [Phytomonas sp. isolate EM1]
MNISISENLHAPTVIFIAGWPDTCDVFRNNIQRALAADYRIVGITIPGFDHDHPFFQEFSRSFPCPPERNYLASTGKHREDAVFSSCTTKRSIPFWEQIYKHPSGSISTSEALPKPPMEGEEAVREYSSRNTHSSQHSSASFSKRTYRATTMQTTEGVLMRTPRFGYSFQDLVTFLEIAVDTAMENYNYYPRAFVRATLDVEDHGEHAQDIPPHQLQPCYPRPILVAHDFGCLLAYELLLARPKLFSRIIALDTGMRVSDRGLQTITRPIRRPRHISAMRKNRPDSLSVASLREEAKTANQIPDKTFALPPAATHCSSSTPSSHIPNSKANGAGVDIPSLAHAEGDALVDSPLSPSEGLTTSITKSTTLKPVQQPPYVESPVGKAHLRGKASAKSFSPPSSPPSVSWRAGKCPKERTGPFQQWIEWGIAFTKELVVILCGLFLPVMIARWVLRILLYLSNRPCYSYDPRYQFSPETVGYTQHGRSDCEGHHEVKKLLKTVELSVGLLFKPRSWIPSFLLRALPRFPSRNPSDGIPLNDYSLLNSFHTPNSHDGRHKDPNSVSLETTQAYNSWCIFMVPFLASGSPSPQCHPPQLSYQQGSRDNPVFPGSEDDVARASDQKTNQLSSLRGFIPDSAAVNDSNLKPWKFSTQYALAESGNKATSHCMWDTMSGVNPYYAYRDRWCEEDYYHGGRLPFNLRGSTPETAGADPSASRSLRSPPNSASESIRSLSKKNIYYKSFFFPPLGVSLEGKNTKNMSEAKSRAAACFYPCRYEGLPCYEESDVAAATFSMRIPSNIRAYKNKMRTLNELSVQVSPEKYWIYLRYWISIFTAWVFSPRQKPSYAPSQPMHTLERPNRTLQKRSSHRKTRGFNKDESSRGGGSTSDGLIYKEGTRFSPLISERHFSPIPIPILFMYGSNKSVMQHSPQWCDYITSVKRVEDGISNAIMINGGGHWFFAEPAHREEVAKWILEFIKTPEK